MSSWWYERAKEAIEWGYEVMNNEESIGETLSEFAYTVQTGYPRYILNNFSVEDLKKFLNHPQIDSFFVCIRLCGNSEDEEMARAGLDCGLVYKNQSKGGKWYISHMTDENYITSIGFVEYITGKPCGEEGYYTDEDEVPTILDDIHGKGGNEEEIEFPCIDSEYEEKILLLRPKTGSFSNHKTRKLVARYESKKDKFPMISGEQYVFQLFLSQPEYLDTNLFELIREMFYKSLTTSSSNETAKMCKKISALFDDTFRAYRVGLLL